MKRLACILLTTALLLCATFHVSGVRAQQPGNVTIMCNTEWTLAQSPINFNGSVTVNNNVTLTIDPGVAVNMGFYMLLVYGTLIAQGTPSSQINFTSGNINQTSLIGPSAPISIAEQYPTSVTNNNPPSIIQNAVLNGVYVSVNSGASAEIDSCIFNFESPYGAPINLYGGNATISNNIINDNIQNNNQYYDYGVTFINVDGSSLVTNNQFLGGFGTSNNVGIAVSGGSPVISGNTFEATYYNNSYGVRVNSGNPQITGNQFQGNGWLVGVDDSSPSEFTIANNVFSDCNSGVNANAGSSLTVQGNQFLKGTDGVDINSAATVTVTGNLIDSNSRYGINGGGTITSNTISNNQIGIHNPPSSVISNNNIVGNTVNSITTTIEDINAQNNWWGTTDTAAINQTIYDKKVDPHLGAVLFVPFLTAPSTSAPAIPSYTPPTTARPTQAPSTSGSWPTSQPVVTPLVPTATPIQYTQTFNYQVGSLINLNTIAMATALVLVLAWVIVILGYAVKGAVSKHKSKQQ